MSIFDHCRGQSAQVWHEFYRWACLCHPDQGSVDPVARARAALDYRALCAQARDALPPDDWPFGDREPKLYDIFCRAAAEHIDPSAAAAGPAPWVAGDVAAAPLSPVGIVRLWPRVDTC